jgi:hypothetical protein
MVATVLAAFGVPASSPGQYASGRPAAVAEGADSYIGSGMHGPGCVRVRVRSGNLRSTRPPVGATDASSEEPGGGA